MKKAKSLVVAMLLVVMTVSLTGCFFNRVQGDKTVKVLYDLYILQEDASAKDIGLKDSEIEKIKTTFHDTLKTTLKQQFASAQLTVSDKDLESVIAARAALTKKLKLTAEITEKDSKKQVVKVSTTYFDETSIATTASEAALKTVQKQKLTSQKEVLNAYASEYCKELVKGYEAYKVTDEKKEFTVSCTLNKLNKNTWMPTDMEGFGKSLGTAISGLLKDQK